MHQGVMSGGPFGAGIPVLDSPVFSEEGIDRHASVAKATKYDYCAEI
jgi:hypothetical protein